MSGIANLPSDAFIEQLLERFTGLPLYGSCQQIDGR